MKDVEKYLKRLNLNESPAKTHSYLSVLHHAHFFNVPFENFSVNDTSDVRLSRDEIFTKVVLNNQGGICFEFSVLLQELFDHIGFSYEVRLARLLIPHTTSATHQLFILNIGSERWLFDVGFGAKGPRTLLLMADGYIHNDQFLSSRITEDAVQGWIISVRENSKPDAVWEAIYSFHDVKTFPADISMAYFYTLHSPESLLNTNSVASLPQENGRISIRNNIFTEVKGFESKSFEIPDDEEASRILKTRFGITVLPEMINHARKK
ncbi:arylamine N-acetyltransferase [Rouxiella silvae]|uniref:Arylamine N-acetyltransferase n=1 Tax=Rouxiella silvae TaxID=1646373 RepID=A0ABX3TTW1_9GAMM|nr:arylamine N-acetyltransferase [Rouxiella silvae]ORJ18644.1 arylamine N-acetyltransferase [Rouxiella silvae]